MPTTRAQVWIKRLAALRPEFEIMGWVSAIKDEPTLIHTPEFMAFCQAHKPFFSDKSNNAVLRAIGSPMQHNAHCETFNQAMDIPRIARAYMKGH